MIKLPIIVCGKVIEASEDRKTITFNYENGMSVEIPALTEDDVKEILLSRLHTGLDQVKLDDISCILQECALAWQQKDCETRKKAVEWCSQVTDYPEYLVEKDYLLFTQLLTQRPELYDQLDADLGNYRYLDEWVPTKDCYTKAIPCGIVTNILVGNIPIASVFGVYRSLVCKNNTICKMPKKDPVGSLMFAMEMVKRFPNHPIVKSLTVAYWERDSVEENAIISNSDALVLWGGEDAINELKKKISVGTKVIEFGPKRSLAMVDLTKLDEGDSLEDVAYRLAQDFSMYNQEACFSSQDMYLIAEDSVYEEFLAKFQEGMNFNLKKYSKDKVQLDSSAHVLITRDEQLFLGNEVISTKDHKWTIVLNDEKVENHPLSRTAFIHRVKSFDDMDKWITKYTQTITMYPWSNQEKYRDRLALLGADRIVATGLSGTARNGFTHDALRPFSEMVRWVSVETDLDYRGKYLMLDERGYVDGLFKSIYKPW